MVMCFEKIKGAKNPTNMLTKCVDVGMLRLCKASIGMMSGRCSWSFENEIIG